MEVFFSLDNYLNSVLKCGFSKKNQKYAPYIKSPFEILYSDLINQIRAGKGELRSDQESVQILCKKYAENFGKMDEEYIKEYIEADFYDGGKYIVKIKSDKKYKDSKVKIAVANVRMSDEDILNILNGKNRDISKRCQEIGRILNEAIRYKADIVFGVEWNKDTYYFGNIMEALSRDIYCYCVQSNMSEYGDSRIIQPTKKDLMNILKVKGWN